MIDFEELPKKKADRVKGRRYKNNKNQIVKWDGKRFTPLNI